MPLSNHTPFATQFVARTVTRLRAGPHQDEWERLARQYRGMSDHSLADIGFCRTRIDFQVFGDNVRR